MDIQSMHIELDLKLQEMGVNNNLSAKKKDWFLYDNTLSFIRDNVRLNNRGDDSFESDIFTIDDLATLKRPASINCYYKDSRAVRAVLPNDYLMLINYRAITSGCSPVDASVRNIRYSKIAFNYDPNDNPEGAIENFKHFKIDIIFDDNGSLSLPNKVFDLSDHYPDGISMYDEYLMIQTILEFTEVVHGVQLYWERYGDFVYEPNCFIFVQDTAQSQDLHEVVFTYDSIAPLETTVAEDEVVTIQYYTFSGAISSERARIVDEEHLHSILDNPFTTTRPESPVSVITQGCIETIHLGKYSVKNLIITYLKWPRTFNLELGIGLELGSNYGRSRDIAKRIVNRTAKAIAAYWEKQNYQALSIEQLTAE